MKKLLLAVLSCVVLLVATSPALSQQKQIRFARGRDSAVIKGRLREFVNTYTFHARMGQTLTVSVNSPRMKTSGLSFTLYSYCGQEFGEPVVGTAQSWSGILPCSAKYSIDVDSSVEPREGRAAENYTLKIRIR
jgi:hypothetical protein